MPGQELTSILASYEDRILRNTYTKADFDYHSIKQSLHIMWANVYHTQGGEWRSASIKKINECLESLERSVAANEQKKYLNYYSAPTRLGNKLEKRALTAKSL